MPFNGSGTYAAPASSWNPAVDGVVINSTDWNALLTDIQTALSTTLTKDGQTAATANIPMGGFKLTGLAAGSASGNSVRYEQSVEGGIMAPIAASLGSDVALNNTGTYFDGPSVAQGSTGKWFVSGTVSCQDTAGAATFNAKLWDGTTLISSAVVTTPSINQISVIALSGFLNTPPAGNLRISVKDSGSTSGKILFNGSGNSKDATITAIRIG